MLNAAVGVFWLTLFNAADFEHDNDDIMEIVLNLVFMAI